MLDDKKLRKMFSNKKFLRKNEFAVLTKNIVSFVKQNQKIVISLAVVVVFLGMAIPVANWYKLNKMEKFNKALFSAEKSLKKEELFQNILTNYSNLPASEIARLKLVDDLFSHQKEAEALKVIDEGLRGNGQTIFKTLLVLQQTNHLKEKNDFSLAASFIKQNEPKVLKTFLNQIRLLRGDLLLLAQNKEEARKTFETVARFSETDEKQQTSLVDFDSQAATTAKEKLLLMDLGVL
ncbi:MAG: tetratricopeptide repeat protein [bacterium]|nr:tetratricopeptide repeat protein [bacterium]MBU1918547.1 tetratricopeptide repeat protein [bacterium]